MVEQVIIPTENTGILEVPKDKKVYELPQKHFIDLIERKGYAPIIRALTNLEVWNKNSNPELSSWASDMADKMKQKFRSEKESIVEQVQTLIEGVQDSIFELFQMSKDDVLEMLKSDIQDILDDNFIEDSEFKIEDMAFYGSIVYGNFTDKSDLDVVVLYSGNMPDDSAFNLLHEDVISLQDKNGISRQIDINPINNKDYSTISEYISHCNNLKDK